jgi:hypothetical protein
MNEWRLKIWKWAAIFLLLCNIGLIVMIWVGSRMQKGGPSETPRDFVIRSLQFSDYQIKQYDALIKDHRKAMNQLRH